MCKNIEYRRSRSHGMTQKEKEEEMRKTKKLMALVKDDKRLLGMLSGILIDVTALVAILVTACVWYLP
jgi:hypothetical protein